MTTPTTPAEIAASLTDAQRTAFLTISKADWHRRPFRADRAGGRTRDFDRMQKCRRLGLIEHRVNAGAEYRLTSLGLVVRDIIQEQSK